MGECGRVVRVTNDSLCVKFWGLNICIGFYPWSAGYKTRYILRERSVYLSGAKGEARGTSEAERKHWPFPRDVTGLTSHWPGIQLVNLYYAYRGEYTV